MIFEKVKAYTIMEVTVTMLIASLLIAITFTSYSLIIKSFQSFSTKNNQLGALLTLNHLLTRDFEQAVAINKTIDGITISKDIQVVKYVLKPDFIVRIAARTDTFKVQTNNIITSYENLSIAEGFDEQSSTRVDELSFTLTFNDEQIPYIYHKIYSSFNLYNNDPNAIN